MSILSNKNPKSRTNFFLFNGNKKDTKGRFQLGQVSQELLGKKLKY